MVAPMPTATRSDTSTRWAWSYVRVTFTVDHPTNWSWAGASDGGSYGAYFNGAAYGFQLYHVDQFGDGDYDGSDNFNGAWNQPISHSGVLLPGYTYHLSIDASASATAHYLWSGSGTEHGRRTSTARSPSRTPIQIPTV
jgi:hypothetical protein